MLRDDGLNKGQSGLPEQRPLHASKKGTKVIVLTSRFIEIHEDGTHGRSIVTMTKTNGFMLGCQNKNNSQHPRLGLKNLTVVA